MLAGLIAEMEGTARHQQRAISESEVLSRIAPPPPMDDVAPMFRLAEQLAASADDLAVRRRKCSLLARLVRLPNWRTNRTWRRRLPGSRTRQTPSCPLEKDSGHGCGRPARSHRGRYGRDSRGDWPPGTRRGAGGQLRIGKADRRIPSCGNCGRPALQGRRPTLPHLRQSAGRRRRDRAGRDRLGRTRTCLTASTVDCS